MLDKKTKKVFKYHFRESARISLWFLGIYVVSMIILIIFAYLSGETDLSVGQADTFAVATMIFMLIFGIVTYPGFLREFSYQGVTRNTFYNGMIMSVVSLTLSFTVATLIIAICETIIADGPLWPLRFVHTVLHPVLFNYLFYMCGLMIGITFCGYGVLKGLGSILINIVTINILMNMHSRAFDTFTIPDSFHYPRTYLSFGATLVVGVIVTIICYYLNRNINVKLDAGIEQ